MASFTDKAPTFNPYVQQQPIEAMVKVGMHKQQQYDQGLQKIQSTMDSVAGLDIARDMDKSYLRSKLSDMGKKLTGYASSDFSNSNLTRSVTGLIGSIADDDVVQNAVQSTGVYRKGLKDREEFMKKGLGSESNDWDFNKDAKAWMDSDDQKASFSSKLRPLSDYKKKSLEVLKSVLEDEQITEKDYYFNEKGEPVFTDVTIREKLTGKSKQKIQNALMATLSPEDWTQISTDGRYTYSNMPGESFGAEIKKSHEAATSEYNSERADLVAKMKGAGTGGSQIALQAKLDQMDHEQNRKNSEYDTLDQYLEKEDFEGAKSKLFTMNWMNRMGNSFGSQKTSNEIKKSERAEFKFQREKEARRAQEYNWSLGQSDRHHVDNLLEKQASRRLAERKENREEKKDNAEASNKGFGPVRNTKDQEDLTNMSIMDLNTDIKNSQDAIDAESEGLGLYYTNDEDYQAYLANHKLTEEAMPKKEYLKQYVRDQEKNWKAGERTMKPSLIKFFNKKRNLERDNDTRILIRDRALEKASEKYPIAEVLSEDDQATSFNFELPGGQNIRASAEEVVIFNSKFNTFKSNNGLMLPEQVEEFTKGLTQTEKDLFGVKLKQDRGTFGNIGRRVTKETNIINSVMNDYERKYDGKTTEKLSDRSKFIENYVGERMMEMQGLTHTIDLNTSQTGGVQSNMDQFKSVLEGFASNADKNNGIALSPGVDKESIPAVINKLNNASITIVNDVMVDGVRQTVNRITARSSDNKAVSFDVTENNMDWSLGRYKMTPDLATFQPYAKRIMATKPDGNFGKAVGTTAKDGKATSLTNAHLNNTDFPSLGIYTVTGNIVSTDGDLYSLELNIQDPVTKKYVVNTEFTKEAIPGPDLLKIMQSMGDQNIFEHLMDSGQVSEEMLEALKKASKKSE